MSAPTKTICLEKLNTVKCDRKNYWKRWTWQPVLCQPGRLFCDLLLNVLWRRGQRMWVCVSGSYLPDLVVCSRRKCTSQLAVSGQPKRAHFPTAGSWQPAELYFWSHQQELERQLEELLVTLWILECSLLSRSHPLEREGTEGVSVGSSSPLPSFVPPLPLISSLWVYSLYSHSSLCFLFH